MLYLDYDAAKGNSYNVNKLCTSVSARQLLTSFTDSRAAPEQVLHLLQSVRSDSQVLYVLRSQQSVSLESYL